MSHKNIERIIQSMSSEQRQHLAEQLLINLGASRLEGKPVDKRKLSEVVSAYCGEGKRRYQYRNGKCKVIRKGGTYG